MKVQIERQLLKSLTMTASVIEARDAYTGGHLWRVSRYCGQLAAAGGLSPEMVFLSSLGGFLHDIGKVGIPEGILGKRGKLDDSEYEVVKTHPGIGAALIQDHPLGQLAIDAVQQHHEWVNGGGYPGRLQGEEISLFARITSIADAFDALTSTRPYRQRVDEIAAARTLQEKWGTQFDAQLLGTFVETIASGRLEGVVGYSQEGVPMVECPTCGPVISVPENARDGDVCYCRVCGMKHRLHRDGDTFVVEPSGEKGSAEELKPCPEIQTIDAFISQAPQWVEL